ncbi:MFS transporter (plasmid) [Streptomyces sp. NBC_01340]|uniref:MFS transporter n=1 Tax=unclassified Streptomyces TaxID=2593676 RepID=UPI0022528DE4|nr:MULTISPECIES: MFS transporter [unclassified Streptomyces]MCX4460957.1 MFS transporter [Streptomyces sp. NBC_01719]MCX4499714.1 MFS transporter [Streptomyces sp. NBC_01728]WSI44872.1 MFS transporter [Streptomyces sp. NBC_01340]
MRAIGFLSFYDRFATAPMLVLLAEEEGTSLDGAVQLVTSYVLLYALGQPIWGLLADRLGRLRVLRLALVGTLLGSAASVAAPGFAALLVIRAMTGLFVGSLFPSMLTIVGDSYTGAARAREISSLQTFTALGTTAATLAAGGLAAWLDWRVVFALTAAGAALSLVLLRRVRFPAVKGARREVRSAFTAWPVWTYVLGLLEGAILLGILTYIVPALERDGLSTALAGAVGATYGAGIIGGAYLARQVVARIGRTSMIAIGSSTLFVAFLLASLSQGVTALTTTSVLIGTSNAFLHSSLQGWATDVAPGARATTVSLFVASVFLGSSAATGLTAGLTRNGYGSVFTATCVATVVLAVLAVGSHVLWSRRRTG